MSTDTIAITGAALVREVAKVAQERPDFRYTDQRTGMTVILPTCSYLTAGRGVSHGEGCGVGQALARLGFDMEAVAAFENRSENSTIDNLIEEFGIPATAHEVEWLAEFQRSQDMGATWGQSVINANRHV